MTLTESMRNHVDLTPIEGNLSSHFHFYITNKGRNEMADNINSLDSSDGRVKGCNPQG